MRPIRMMAWDIDDKKMISEAAVASWKVEELNKLQDDGKWILIEFTGLHDINRKEIFEGYICNVKCFIGEVGAGKPGELGIVAYVERAVMKWLPKKAQFAFELENSLIPEEADDLVVEVLGNIWENPGLLK